MEFHTLPLCQGNPTNRLCNPPWGDVVTPAQRKASEQGAAVGSGTWPSPSAFSRIPVKYYILCCCLLRFLPGWDQPMSPEGLRTGQESHFKIFCNLRANMEGKASCCTAQNSVPENSNGKWFIKTLETQINALCHLGVKSNECLPRWRGNSPESPPVMSSPSSLSLSLSPRSRLGSVSGRARQKLQNLQNLPVLCAGNLCGLCKVLFALSLLLTLSAPSLEPCPILSEGKPGNEEKDGIPSMNSDLPFHCWDDFCANGNSWTTGIKIKCLAQGNYHMVKGPDFASGTLLKAFVWFVTRHLIFCASPIKCG